MMTSYLEDLEDLDTFSSSKDHFRIVIHLSLVSIHALYSVSMTKFPHKESKYHSMPQ